MVTFSTSESDSTLGSKEFDLSGNESYKLVVQCTVILLLVCRFVHPSAWSVVVDVFEWIRSKSFCCF